MIAIDAQQDLFSALKIAIEKLGYDVYDGFLPPEKTPYPFIFLGDFRQSDSMHKNAVTGVVYATIHVWHNNPKQRGTVSKMMLDVKKIIYQFEQSKSLVVQSVDNQIMPDNTTKTPLLHGIVEAGIRFS